MERCAYVGPGSDRVLCHAGNAIFTRPSATGGALKRRINVQSSHAGFSAFQRAENMKTRRRRNHRVATFVLVLSTGYNVPGSCIRQSMMQRQTNLPLADL